MSASVFGPFVKPAGLTLKLLDAISQLKNNNLNFVQDGYLTLPPPKMINFGKIKLWQG